MRNPSAARRARRWAPRKRALTRAPPDQRTQDVATFLGPRGLLTTHMTGALAKVGNNFAGSDTTPALEGLGMAGAFFGGALTSGFLTSRKEWKTLLTCSLTLVCVGVLHCAVAALTNGEQATAGAYVAAYAAGLQNGMLTTITGFLRTTHVTGTVTDVGLLVGQAYPTKWNDSAHWWKTRVLATDLIFFVSGALAARCLFDAGLDNYVAYVSAGIAFFVGCSGLVHIYLELREAQREAHQDALDEAKTEAEESGIQRRPTFRSVSFKDLSRITNALEALEEISRGMAGNINSMPDPPEKVVSKMIKVNTAAKIFKSKSKSVKMREEQEKEVFGALEDLCRYLYVERREVFNDVVATLGERVGNLVEASCVEQIDAGRAIEPPGAVVAGN